MMKKLEKEVLELGKRFKKENQAFEKLVRQYDRIAIFRHIMPDYDALGTQLGLYHFIKDNFPNKEVIVVGDNHVTFTPRLFQEMDKVNDSWFDTPFLAIICDVGAKKRIADPRFSLLLQNLWFPSYLTGKENMSGQKKAPLTSISVWLEITEDSNIVPLTHTHLRLLPTSLDAALA